MCSICLLGMFVEDGEERFMFDKRLSQSLFKTTTATTTEATNEDSLNSLDETDGCCETANEIQNLSSDMGDETSVVPVCSDEHDTRVLAYCLKDANLKDFTSTTGTSHLESTSFASIICNDGKQRVVKKSSIAWYLENKVQQLSNDRKVRVTQNSSSSSEEPLIRNQQVQKRQLQTGDWAVFKTIEKRKTTILVGRIISFANLSDTKKIVIGWNPEAKDDYTGVLCVWYILEKVRQKFTGNLLESAVHHHGFHPCFNSYVCTVPPPAFDAEASQSKIFFPDKITLEISKFLKSFKKK